MKILEALFELYCL